MKGDFSRQTFRPERHYSSVRMQQGRVQLDADWNEQADVVRYRDEIEATDVIGSCGGPLGAAAFAVALDLTGLDAVEKARLDKLFPPAPFTLAAGDFLLGPGRYYVDGILCENEHFVPYTGQPDLPGLKPLDVTKTGFHIVYLDVWQRHLTALDDPRLREPALGGPDTATRTRNVWQVRSVFAGTGATNCLSSPAAYKTATAPSTASLRARAKKEAATTDPCLVPQAAGFRGLENQLYRVEIHDPGAPYDLITSANESQITAVPAANQLVFAGGTWAAGQAVEVFLKKPGSEAMAGQLAFVASVEASTKTLTLNAALAPIALADQPHVRRAAATYKWSRDNGSVVALVKSISGRDVVVHSLGPDAVLGFQAGQWLELTDDERELSGLPGHLGQIESVNTTTSTITLRAAPTPFPGNVSSAAPARHLKARRWDGVGAAKIKAPSPSEGFAELESGVQIRFEAGTALTGDHWLIPARTATADAQSGTIEWPVDGTAPAALPAEGIVHHYCKLAVLECDGTKLKAPPVDCRSLFPPTTELATLVYVGGDGQETLPGQRLPQQLEAGVFRGRSPVAGARVSFVADGNGKLAATEAGLGLPAATNSFEPPAGTGADGVARCFWLPDPDTAKPSQRVVARLLDAAGTALPAFLDYNAQLSLASKVAYTPDPACADLAGADTVQEAVDLLCKRPTGGGCSVVVRPDQRLDKVIPALLEGGARALCLCLLPGEHKLPEGLQLERNDVVLRICGCGAGTRLVLGKPVVLKGLSQVALRSLEVFAKVRGAAGQVALTGCRDVIIEGCTFRALDENPPDLVAVGGARRIRIVGNVFDGHFGSQFNVIGVIVDFLQADDRDLVALKGARIAEDVVADEELRKSLIEEIDAAAPTIKNMSLPEQRAYAALREAVATDKTPGPIAGALLAVYDIAAHAWAIAALAIEDGSANALVADNEIVGYLTLYGPSIEDAALNQEQLKELRGAMATGKVVLRPGVGTLDVRGNRLSRLTLADGTITALANAADQEEPLRLGGLFRAIHLTDNTLSPGQNLVLASHVALTSNEFDPVAREFGVSAVMADSAVYTGNAGPPETRIFNLASRRADAANLLSIVNP